jgi:hypothetical protein
MTMDWIERLFGISPDGGDGSTEMLYLVAAAAIVGLILGRSFLARRARMRRGVTGEIDLVSRVSARRSRHPARLRRRLAAGGRGRRDSVLLLHSDDHSRSADHAHEPRNNNRLCQRPPHHRLHLLPERSI